MRSTNTGGVSGQAVFGWVERYSLSLLIGVGFLVVWQFGAPLLNPDDLTLVPTFTEVLANVFGENRARIRTGLTQTVIHFTVGFALSVSLGVVLGVVFSEFYVVRQMGFPIAIFSYSIPHAILAPIFILWFGTGLLGVGLFAAWTGFFSVFVNTMTGMTQVEEEFVHLGELFEATRWQMFKSIKFWNALPHISSGIKISVQQTMAGVIIAEFIATGNGLAWIIRFGQQYLQVELMWGAILAVGITATLIFMGATWVIDRLEPTSVD